MACASFGSGPSHSQTMKVRIRLERFAVGADPIVDLVGVVCGRHMSQLGDHAVQRGIGFFAQVFFSGPDIEYLIGNSQSLCQVFPTSNNWIHDPDNMLLIYKSRLLRLSLTGKDKWSYLHVWPYMTTSPDLAVRPVQDRDCAHQLVVLTETEPILNLPAGQSRFFCFFHLYFAML